MMSTGGGIEPERLGNPPGQPIVVRYAPQLDLLQRASAVITHAGLNTERPGSLWPKGSQWLQSH